MKRLHLNDVKPGLILACATLLFGIALAVMFGVAEDAVKDAIAKGVAAHPALHDAKSPAKIWRWWQRAHFHATGIAAFTFALVGITALSGLRPVMKKLTSLLLGLGGLYPVSWLVMALLAPSMGRSAAHNALGVEVMVFVAVFGMLSGLGLLFSNILLGSFSEKC